MTTPFVPDETLDADVFPSDPTAGTECPCTNPDDQYLLEVDAGAVYLTHKACGKQPRAWLDDAFSLARIPVTLHWHDGRPTHPDDDDNSYGVLTVNGRAVLHDDKPYLIGRDYRGPDGDLWRITDRIDSHGRPLGHLMPEGAGHDMPIDRIVTWNGPLFLVPRSREGS